MDDAPNSHRVLRPAEVAELLNCSVDTVEERARSGDLPGLKFSNQWVFPERALFVRLDELALEAAKTRKRRPPAKATATLHAVPRPGRRRAPPVLPELPDE